MKKLLIFMFLIFPNFSWATTYYMRADGTAANKAAATGPCGTQANCMSMTIHNGETFSAGDTIILCDDGGNYESKLIPPSPGSSGNVITYQEATGDTVYVSGADQKTSWTQDGSDWYTSSASEPAILFESDTDTVFTEVATKGELATSKYWWDSGNSRIYLRCSDGGNPNTHLIWFSARTSACNLDTVDYITFENLDFYGSSGGSSGYAVINIYNGADHITFTNCNVKFSSGTGVMQRTGAGYVTWTDSEISYSDYHGYYIWDTGGTDQGHNEMSGGEVKYTGLAQDGQGNGIFWENTDYNTISGVTLSYNNGAGGTAGVAIWLKEVNNSIIEENWIHHNTTDQAVYFTHGSQYNEFRYNLMNDNTGSTNVAFNDCDYNKIYGNIIHSGKYPALGLWTVVAGETCDYNEIYNNTFANMDASWADWGIFSFRIYDTDGDTGDRPAQNNTVKNNIFYMNDLAADGFMGWFSSSSGDSYANWTNNTFDNNTWYCPTASRERFKINTTTYTTFASYKSAFEGANSAWQNPVFTDQANDDYTLTSGSPCIGTGTDLGNGLEYALNPSSSWPSSVLPIDPDSFGASGWPIGAFESSGITITATDSSASEAGPDTGTFRISRPDSSGNLVVNFTLGGTAGVDDYDEDLSGGTVTILDGNTFVDQTITPTDDSDVEGQETLTMTIAADSYTIGSPSQASITIADNESVEGEAGLVIFGSGTGAATRDSSGTGVIRRQ